MVHHRVPRMPDSRARPVSTHRVGFCPRVDGASAETGVPAPSGSDDEFHRKRSSARGRTVEQGVGGGGGRRMADVADRSLVAPHHERRAQDLRHRARAALQILYHGTSRILMCWRRPTRSSAPVAWPHRRLTGCAPSPPARARHRGPPGTIDPLIAETAGRWRPERMAVLDRLVRGWRCASCCGAPARRRR